MELGRRMRRVGPSTLLRLRAKASCWHRRPRLPQLGTNSFLEEVKAGRGRWWERGGGKFGEERAAQETQSSSPRELLACVIAMVGRGH